MTDPSSADNFFFITGLLAVNIIGIGLIVEIICFGKGDVESIRNHSKIKLALQYLPGLAFFVAAAAIAGWQHYGLHGSGEVRKLAEEGYANTSKTDYSDWTLQDLPIGLLLIRYVFVLCQEILRANILQNYTDFRKWSVPTNIDYLIVRYNEFNMLMFGEPVLSLLIVSTVENSVYYAVALLGVLTATLLALIKFGSDPASTDDHALWRGVVDGKKYSILLQILSLSLIGACYKHFLKIIKERSYKDNAIATSRTDVPTEDEHHRMLGEEYAVNGEEKKSGEALFCAAIALVLITLEFIGMSHYKGTRRNLRSIFSGGNTTALFVLKNMLLCLLVTYHFWVEDFFLIAIGSLLVVALFLFFRILEWNIQAKREQESFPDRAFESNCMYD